MRFPARLEGTAVIGIVLDQISVPSVKDWLSVVCASGVGEKDHRTLQGGEFRDCWKIEGIGTPSIQGKYPR
jgi:hypothetical protein